MPELTIILEGDGAVPEMAGAKVHHVQDFIITGLAGGMSSGRPSAAIIVKLDDGSFVFAETSLRLLLAAADALKAKYGDPR